MSRVDGVLVREDAGVEAGTIVRAAEEVVSSRVGVGG